MAGLHAYRNDGCRYRRGSRFAPNERPAVFPLGAIIEGAYDGTDDGLKNVLKLFTNAPEFHATNAHCREGCELLRPISAPGSAPVMVVDNIERLLSCSCRAAPIRGTSWCLTRTSAMVEVGTNITVITEASRL